MYLSVPVLLFLCLILWGFLRELTASQRQAIRAADEEVRRRGINQPSPSDLWYNCFIRGAWATGGVVSVILCLRGLDALPQTVGHTMAWLGGVWVLGAALDIESVRQKNARILAARRAEARRMARRDHCTLEDALARLPYRRATKPS